MAKQDDFASFDEAEVASQIASRVFANEFKHLRERIAKQESTSLNIMLGSIVAMFFILAGLIWGAWAFVGEYNQHYLDAMKEFNTEATALKTTQNELQLRINQQESNLEQLSLRAKQ